MKKDKASLTKDFSSNDESVGIEAANDDTMGKTITRTVKVAKRKPPAHAFKAGNKFGKGRPQGSKSNAELHINAIGEEAAEAILQKVVARALEGHFESQKLILERFYLVPKGRRINIDIPEVNSIDGIAQALRIVFDNVAKGELYIDEGLHLSKILVMHLDTIHALDLEGRMKAIEEQLKAMRL